ncbi:hypothetical protein FHP88_15590 [Sedimenticola selenatireducens]|uniref:MarR family transcriptional regulator n=1 Tax=Sedimenticola selenatireducens TaxID=191960 RepID=A0A557S0B8_9GAMM|nr:hypothetical protein [Sedimenticola selenatireducens]TVO70875.1 hypothetical protein FHP88_15590 [Sedimenticola selenatireducens]
MSERYLSNSQQRILRILIHLGGHEVHGLAPGEISKSLDITPANVTHDLANLKHAGLAEPLSDSNRWRLTPRIPQIGVAMLNGIGRAESKLAETKQRFSTQPY